MLYGILCNNRPLATLNPDGTANCLATETEIGAIEICKKLNNVIGKVQYCEIPDPRNKQVDNFKLPSEGKTLYNIASSYYDGEGEQ